MRHAVLAVTPSILLVAGAAWAADEPVRLQLTIRDHRFAPTELHVAPNTPIIIEVRNEDPTAEEFESTELGVEKVIAGGRSLPVRIRPMPPGRYRFIGEYHQETAAGVLVVDAGG